MDLDDGTRDELAGFFARRFPSAEARAGIARAAGIPPGESSTEPREAWRGLLDAADRARALPRLAAAARAAAPEDRNLVEACALLSPARAAPRRPVALLAGVGALLVIAGGGAWLAASGPSEDVERPAPVAAVAAAEVPVASEAPPAPVAAAASAVVPVASEAPPAPEAPVVPEAPPPARAPAASEAPPPAAPTPATPADPTVPARCLGAPGSVIGWWYAGTTPPGVQGTEIRLPGSVNVRDDYPREENGYSMRSTVLCSLSIGTRQRLSLPPVDIGRGQWWVPVAGGDL